jgi:quercetin dioxygenase-like cupin family protein
MRRMKLRGLLFLPILALFLAQAQTAAPAVALTSEPSHHLALENEYLRAFEVEVASHASTLLHRHERDYVFVTLGDTEVENAVEGKAPVRLKLADGESRFVPGNFAHVARNLSGHPFRNVTLELLPGARPALPEAPGTPMQKVLFVQDGVRVSDVRLAPGAMLPRHEHKGPHLVVAVSDLNVRSDVEGQGPMPGVLKSGDIKWLPGGYTHTLTNTGLQEAHFITLEF